MSGRPPSLFFLVNSTSFDLLTNQDHIPFLQNKFRHNMKPYNPQTFTKWIMMIPLCIKESKVIIFEGRYQIKIFLICTCPSPSSCSYVCSSSNLSCFICARCGEVAAQEHRRVLSGMLLEVARGRRLLCRLSGQVQGIVGGRRGCLAIVGSSSNRARK